MAGTRASLSAGKGAVSKFQLADKSEGTITIGTTEVNVKVGGTDTNFQKICGVLIEYKGGVWGETMSEAETAVFLNGVKAFLECTGGTFGWPKPFP
ncbi:hypothetical protein A3A71_03235 [Candidatus Berkelbacteria bacterium RIFCSPLOWO2_01_FULL_50_28]|uniref:Uncharacterized protein n=1 Tax=Candidatus Berkelbacteria bacterium RIFCSPLOWO2_01_FULL_50_28 TaxID=1797471 RepID=A0A1F5ECG6_9BACT|nr:MAG: hypothetical protein A2807_02800 [Candidatus Berkelbacteria bacterium RIFCSPHIGHO2_01_FULL_50_36]OGD63801.1 MAG: hypothetical protein A3F39_03635 [Candidatus Berkelbacteria bacterium RIFCSPHIGHO2_12_FULL_50_11]OGD65075.1 MAG: hypothetical protein A3A71_03235 [Candidatus Berkelbacteria bacterium RIFCSPLOWO2_01_FULL_50_28]